MANGPSNSKDLPRPGTIGRVVRLLLGVLLLFFFAQVARNARGFLVEQQGWHTPGGDWWIVAAICLLALSGIVNDGFSRQWGRRPSVAFLALLVAAAAWDRIAYGALWAAPLGFLVLLLILYVFGHAGLSFLAAAAAATPG